jgi:ketosteroid isomerase-like protein
MRPAATSLSAINSPAAPASPLSERFTATPRLACEALARAIESRDLETALACFSPGACLVGPDGKASHGEGAIRSLLGGLIAHGARVRIELYGVLVAGDVALAHERWQISAGQPSPSQAPAPTMVLRLAEGEWKVAIAAPWGTAASAPLEAVWP